MSMNFFDIDMYGVVEHDLIKGNKSFYQISRDLGSSPIVFTGGESVMLKFAFFNDNACLGLVSSFPWEYKFMKLENVTKDHVKEALVAILIAYKYDKQDILDHCKYIGL